MAPSAMKLKMRIDSDEKFQDQIPKLHTPGMVSCLKKDFTRSYLGCLMAVGRACVAL
jgi:hypothetical protein